MNYNNLCYRCFSEKPIMDKPCPICGYNYTPDTTYFNCLPPGSLLYQRYVVGVALGVGGFGITYKCLDTELGGICAIKEYFPANIAVRNVATKLVSVAGQNLERYNKIMNRFVEEADLVKKLHHRNIITIYDSFFENNTAYYVMEYCDGIDLRRYTNNFTRRLEYDEGINILFQVMNGLEYIHSAGILHRDIAPDNIYITKMNTIKILDFGSARSEMDQYNKELSAIVKVGYAPIEQYGGHGKQGPYTDIYALGATFYHLFTSKIPLESTQRGVEDNLEAFSQLRPDLPDNLKYCIERSMALTTSNRISSIAEMKNILGFPSQSSKETSNELIVPYDPQKQNDLVEGSVSEVADISLRMGAFATDLVIWGVIFFGILFGIFGRNGIIYLGILFPVVFTLINTVLELTMATTVGKAMFKLYVRDKSGGEMMPGQVLLRNIVKLVSVFIVVFKKNRELLEDKVTNSIVCIKN